MKTKQIEGIDVGANKNEQGGFGLKIKELETKVNDLKEKVFQSKSRIVLLRETVLSGNLAGSRAMIVHRSDGGPAYKLRAAIYSLDGNRIFSEVDDDDSLADRTVFDVYDDAIRPGNHTLSVNLKYQGSGYGIFPYFEGYSFDVRSSCQFKAEEGKIAQVRVVAYEAGNIATSKEDRLAIQCELTYADNVKDDQVAKPAKGKKKAKPTKK
jgi:hypothetical protein